MLTIMYAVHHRRSHCHKNKTGERKSEYWNVCIYVAWQPRSHDGKLCAVIAGAADCRKFSFVVVDILRDICMCIQNVYGVFFFFCFGFLISGSHNGFF